MIASVSILIPIALTSAREPRQRHMKPSKFLSCISPVFDKCMGVYVVAQDRILEGMMEQFMKTFKSEGFGEELDESEGKVGLFYVFVFASK